MGEVVVGEGMTFSAGVIRIVEVEGDGMTFDLVVICGGTVSLREEVVCFVQAKSRSKDIKNRSKVEFIDLCGCIFAFKFLFPLLGGRNFHFPELITMLEHCSG
jgi:hypothetical protein